MTRKYWIRKILLAGAMVCSLASNASERGDKESLLEGWQDWQQVGSAQLTVFIFDIYYSRLLTPTGAYMFNHDITPHPLALDIVYQRDISQQQLLEATHEQWTKLGFNQTQSSLWIDELAQILPNIKKGQGLTYITDGQSGQFIHSLKSGQQSTIGTISDESLNDAFVSIWLSPKTEYPDLRKDLLGTKR